MPDLTVRPLSESEYSLWDSFVDSWPQGTIFNTSVWGAIVQKVFPVDQSIYVATENDVIVGGISLFHKRRAGLKILTRIPLSPYMGILFASSRGEKAQKSEAEQHEIVNLILPQLEKNFHFAQFSLHPSATDVRAFLWRRWDRLPEYTYLNSLSNLSHAWELLSSSLRRKITHAEEREFRIVRKDNPSQLLAFQEMSYAKWRLRPPVHLHALKAFCSEAMKANLLRVYAAIDREGNVHAERAVILYKENAYDWIAGTNLRLADAHANQLLVWKIFKELSKEGIWSFDFLGANTQSIAEFKRGFGGELTCYFEVRYFASAWIQWLNYFNQEWIRLRRMV